MLRREMVVEGVQPIKILSIFCWDVWSVKTFVTRCCVELIVERQVASSWQYAAHVLRWLSSGHRWRQLYLASASTTSANHCTDEPGFSDTFWLHINVSHFESHRNKERLWVWHSCKVLHSLEGFWQVSNFRLTPIFIALTWFVSRMIVMSLYYVRSVSVAWCYFQDLSDYNRLENLPLDIEWHAFSGTWRLLFRQRAIGPCKPSPEKLVWKTLNVWESIRDACLWCSALQTFCCEKNMFGETWCIIGR